MKKLVSFLCSIIFVCGISSGALAYTVQCDEVYDFAGPRYGISYIDTDGSLSACVPEKSQSAMILKTGI